VVPTDPSVNPDAPRTPKSFVMRSGVVGKSVRSLVHDIRRVMDPNTASRLRVSWQMASNWYNYELNVCTDRVVGQQERKSNKLKDFIHIAGQLGVSHFVILSKTDVGANMRIGRSPKGPTLTFRVHEYALAKDVLMAQSKPKSPGSEFIYAPLVSRNDSSDASLSKACCSCRDFL
jgi:ribosome biogenesis protein SSF1/2